MPRLLPHATCHPRAPPGESNLSPPRRENLVSGAPCTERYCACAQKSECIQYVLGTVMTTNCIRHLSERVTQRRIPVPASLAGRPMVQRTARRVSGHRLQYRALQPQQYPCSAPCKCVCPQKWRTMRRHQTHGRSSRPSALYGQLPNLDRYF